MAVLDFTDV